MLLLVTIVCPVDFVQRYRLKVMQKIMWGSVITFFDEGYIIVAFSCFTSLGVLDFDEFGTTITSVLSLASFIVILGFPIMHLIFLRSMRLDLEEPEVQQMYGPFIEHLDLRDL
jgi:hypothetical protein